MRRTKVVDTPLPPRAIRKPQYIPLPDEKKKKRGRPTKYERVIVTDEKGEKRIINMEVDKHRYWFVSFTYVLFDVTHKGSITFETSKNKIFSMYDLTNLVGNRNLSIVWWNEFKDKAEYKEFSRTYPLENNGMSVLQV